VIFLVLSVAGIATLWMAILADDGAALVVILNSLRVLTFRYSSN
jgi:Zn2+/Cd2+-exporting ATPase